MEERSRIRFNPATREIEIEGSEEFVRIYFGKVQKLLLASASGKEKKPKPPRARPAGKLKKMKKKTGPKKVLKKVLKKVPKETLLDSVVRLIRGSGQGITTAALKEKTGLAESQIWSIVYRAEKQGKIKKTKRGIYITA
jgi:uncharacterized membrane protein